MRLRPRRSRLSRRHGLVAVSLVVAALVSISFVWLVVRPAASGLLIMHDTLSATTSFHWTLDRDYQGDCFVRAAQACADDAAQGAFAVCSRPCIDPMIWAHVPVPQLVAVELLGGIRVWHLAGQPSDWRQAWASGKVDIWISFDHHPLEARTWPDFSDHYTFRYSCFNRVYPVPFHSADHPQSPPKATSCSSW